MNFFQKPIGFLTVFSVALLSAVLHNFVYWRSGVEEPVFFILTFIALGIEIILLLILFINLIRKAVNRKK